jgi:hypothetical protein
MAAGRALALVRDGWLLLRPGAATAAGRLGGWLPPAAPLAILASS